MTMAHGSLEARRVGGYGYSHVDYYYITEIWSRGTNNTIMKLHASTDCRLTRALAIDHGTGVERPIHLRHQAA